MRKNNIPTLDGWRAIAIGLVILCHAPQCLYPTDPEFWANSPTLWGAFGVDVFFGLSGLLITRLLLQEWRDEGEVSLRGFYIRRAFRILPPFLLYMTAVLLAGMTKSRLEVVSSFLFFRNYIPITAGDRWTQHFWSLSVEEHFYLLWPALLVFAGRKRSWNLAVWFAIGVGLWRIADRSAGNLPGLLPYFRTDIRLDSLLWGCAVAVLLDDPVTRQKLARALNPLLWTGLVVALVACIKFFSLLMGLWVPMLIPFILAGTGLHPEWFVSRMLDSAPMRWLGRFSYSMYLWQEILLVPAWNYPRFFWQKLPWNIVAIVAVSAASYYLLERPLLHFGRGLAARVARSKKPTLRIPFKEAVQES